MVDCRTIFLIYGNERIFYLLSQSLFEASVIFSVISSGSIVSTGLFSIFLRKNDARDNCKHIACYGIHSVFCYLTYSAI